MINDTIKNLLIFTTGAAIGSAVTWKLLKTKYEQIAQDEIDSVKEVFSRRFEEESEDIDESDDEDEEYNYEPTEEDKASSNNIIKEMKYTSYSKKKNKNSKRKHSKNEDEELVPYVISPDDFGDNGYDTESFTYYADDVLANDYDEIIEDRELLIGNYSLSSFGTYEEDIVHVRNDETQTDYEICRVNEKYSDVVSSPDETED